MQLSVTSHVPEPCPSTGTGVLGEDTGSLTHPLRNTPVEVLPYVRCQRAHHHLHPHCFPGRLSSIIGCKEVVVRDGALLHIPVGLVLQELLGHVHCVVALPEGVREENDRRYPQQDPSPAVGLCVAGDQEPGLGGAVFWRGLRKLLEALGKTSDGTHSQELSGDVTRWRLHTGRHQGALSPDSTTLTQE